MYLESLSLINYKSFDEASFELDEKINCFVGANGIGKTNVLDAVYHLAFAKSYFNPITKQNIRHGTDFFVIDGRLKQDGKTDKIVISAKKGAKRIVKKNGKEYERISDHIGYIPLVIISPTDRDLILEGSSTRRKFMDSVISLQNQKYLHHLIDYQKLLDQRNSLLKYFKSNNTYNGDALAVYDEQMAGLGEKIHEVRKAFVESLVPIFKKFYQQISQREEQMDIHYKSDLTDNDSHEVFKDSLQKDMQLLYTSAGIHKDDLVFQMDGFPVKKFGSQGQQKSFLTALKIAQFDFLKERAQKQPILLLDDIFDKLDESRVQQIVKMVDDGHFGQIFISDTHPERTREVVEKVHQSFKIFEL